MHVLQNSGTSVKISSFGAEIKSIIHEGKEIIYQGAEGFWQRSSPVLFPIVGKLNRGEYYYNNHKYSMDQHGFARDLEFELTSKGVNTCTFTLYNASETLTIYPFKFELNIKYILEIDCLKTIYFVKNLGENAMFYNVGAHPAFALDLNKKYSLLFDAADVEVQGLSNGERVTLSKKLNMKNLEITEELFAADTIIIDNTQGVLGNIVSLVCGNNRVIALQFDCPYFGIWKQVNSSFICLEPWWGVADSATHGGKIEEKEGILMLKPNEIQEHFWSILF